MKQYFLGQMLERGSCLVSFHHAEVFLIESVVTVREITCSTCTRDISDIVGEAARPAVEQQQSQQHCCPENVRPPQVQECSRVCFKVAALCLRGVLQELLRLSVHRKLVEAVWELSNRSNLTAKVLNL